MVSSAQTTMRLLPVKLLLLCSFAFWATGAAKVVHELVEHHGGHVSSVVDVDDDDDAPVTVAPPADPAHAEQPVHHGHPCPVCEMLAAMVVDQPSPPVTLTPTLDVIATLAPPRWEAPLVTPTYVRLTTGPPALAIAA